MNRVGKWQDGPYHAKCSFTKTLTRPPWPRSRPSRRRGGSHLPLVPGAGSPGAGRMPGKAQVTSRPLSPGPRAAPGLQKQLDFMEALGRGI